MNSMERVLTAMSHNEPDRVPNFLLLTMHGAKELGLSLKDYFCNAEAIVEGQILLQKKYAIDCYYSFLYAPIEIEALGGEVIFTEDGPPNTGTPILSSDRTIKDFQFPQISDSEPLLRVLKVINDLSKVSKGSVPVIGVAVSPLSLPVMQLGFERYLDIFFNNEELFYSLMKKNTDFCIKWANAQLEAGATAICYFDPVSSPSMIPEDQFLKKGLPIVKDVYEHLNGPLAFHLASGRILPIIDEIIESGAAAIGVSVLEDLAEIKAKARGKLTIIGNLNAIEMCHWDNNETEAIIKETILKAASGGGFLLSDNHGEIPYQVPDETLAAIAESVKKWGTYPIQDA